jgi:hypothetical protein
MTWIAQSLWELVKPVPPKPFRKAHVSRPAKQITPIQARYDALVVEMKQLHGFRVRKWRKNSSGVARLIKYSDGREVKLIEAPYPRGPMSCAIFLHEVGHHVIGLGVYRPRCLEEYHVWVWAIQMMRTKGFNVTAAVERRMDRSMRYAVGKALRRGIQALPPELEQFR